jgi:glutathione-regulated potassium-efflux system protein KefB
MDPHSFIYSAVLLLMVAAVAVAVFRRLGLGSILGLLVTGVILGPHTPGSSVTTEVEGVRQFTEIGIVLLLFLIGLEMKPKRLWAMRKVLFGLGSLQVLITALCIGAYFRMFKWDWDTALLLGASFALSSSAIVIQLLREQGEMTSKTGQTAFAVLLMQDLVVVPLMAMVPIVADNGPLPQGMALWGKVGIATLLIVLVIVGGRYVVPRVLDYMARQNQREGFFMTAMAAVFAAALAMDVAGMSMALGGFLMGMMLSTSRYSLQIEASIEPHKGLLMSLFFVAVGMSVDLHALVRNPWQFASHVVAILLIKIAVLFVLCIVFGTGRNAAVRIAFMLSQGGEFGFVVFGAAKALRIIDNATFVTCIAIISVTMLLTPLLARLGASVAKRWFAGGRGSGGGSGGKYPQSAAHESGYATFENQLPVRVVIAGYGRVGHTIGTILGSSNIPYIAFETDAALVDKWRTEGHPVYFGDICDVELFSSSALHSVELVVLTLHDMKAAVLAATLIHTHSPTVKIVARSRDLVTCDALQKAGVHYTFPEALEASLRLAAQSLEALGITTNETDSLLHGVRSSDYEMVRTGPEALPKV